MTQQQHNTKTGITCNPFQHWLKITAAIFIFSPSSHIKMLIPLITVQAEYHSHSPLTHHHHLHHLHLELKVADTF